MDREKIIQLMTNQHLFEGASPDLLGNLVDHGEVITIEGDTVLIEQGKIGEAVWVLLEGKVKIIESSEAVREIDLPGTILGEISAVSHTAATATVKASTPLSALRITHQDFHQALASSDQLASAVLRSLAKYLG